MDLNLLRNAEQCVYREARLLDEERYDEWLELYEDDARYWIPSWIDERDLVEDPSQELSLAYWDKPAMRRMVSRLKSGWAHVYEPPPRISRLISNLIVEEAEEGGTYAVNCRWMLNQQHRGTQQLFGGWIDYVLSSDFKILSKRVRLINDEIKLGYLVIV